MAPSSHLSPKCRDRNEEKSSQVGYRSSDKHEQEIERRGFHLIGTGQKFDDTHLNYVGTVQKPPWVWHIYEEVGTHEQY